MTPTQIRAGSDPRRKTNHHTHQPLHAMKTTIKTVRSDFDSKNRQFIWTAFSDGSARSREITHHTGDPARPSKETWCDDHEAGSELAAMIHAMPA